MSVMVTIWVQLDEFPQASVAVQTTLVTPTGNWAGALFVIATDEQLSVAVAVPKTTVVEKHSLVSTVPEAAAGHAITGATTSLKLMVWLAFEVLPQASLAVQFRVMLYVFGHDPGVVTSTNVKVKLLPQASIAVGVVQVGGSLQSSMNGGGKAEITGASISCTKIS